MADAASLLIKLGFRADAKPLQAIEARLDALNNKLRIVAGAEIVRGLYALSQRFGGTSTDIQNAAAAAGLTTEALQKLQFAAGQSGADAEGLSGSMQHLAKQLYQARIGGQEAMNAFYQLGISAQQIASFKDTEQALYGVMDALKRVRDPIKQQALIEQVLGRGSRGMVRFALAGSAAARASGAHGKAMGAIIPASALAKLTEARIAVDSMHKVFSAVTATIGAKFAPVVTYAAKIVGEFYQANKAVINLSLEKWVDQGAYALGFLLGLFRTVGKGVVDFLGKHENLLGSVIKMAAAIKGVSIAFDLLSGGLTGAKIAIAAGGAVLTAAPYLGMAAALAICVVLLHDMYTLLTHGSIKDMWVYQLMTGTGEIGSKVQSMFDAVAGVSNFFVPGSFGPEVSGSGTTVRGMELDDPRLTSLVARANQLSLPGGFIASLGTPSDGPPMSMAGPSSSSYYASQTKTVTMNNTIVVPPDMTPDQAAKAVSQGVKQHLDGQSYLDQTYRNFDSPFAY